MNLHQLNLPYLIKSKTLELIQIEYYISNNSFHRFIEY